MTLRRRTFIIAALIVIIPLLLLAALDGLFTSHINETYSEQAVEAYADIALEGVRLGTNSCLEELSYIVTDPIITKCLQQSPIPQQSSDVFSLLLRYKVANVNLLEVSLTDAEYNIVASTNTLVLGDESAPSRRQINLIESGSGVLDGGDREAFTVIVPVISRGEFIGCVQGRYTSELFEALTASLNTPAGGSITVLDTAGSVVSSGSEYSFARLTDLSDISNMNSRLEKYSNVEGVSMPFTYTIDGETRMAFVAHLNPYGWTVISTFTYQNRHLPTMVTVIVACVAVAVLFVFISRSIFEPLGDLFKGVESLNDENYKERLPYIKDGEFDGIRSAFNKLLDKIERDHKELLIKEKRHRIVNELSNSIIFEYNIETGLVECSPNGKELSNYPECFDDFPLQFVKRGTVHKDDAETFSHTFNEMLCGRHKSELEIRLHNADGSYRWYQLLLTTIIDDVTLRPLRIVGKLNDIDDEKRSNEMLKYKANRDSLTGVYNKGATKALSLEKLEMHRSGEKAALLVMDVDDFKRVNDGYGHQKGDEVLVQIASAIGATYRADDVVGRIGGDEFMVLMCAVNNKDIVQQRVEQLLEKVNKIPLDEKKGDYMSLSIGVAIFPQDGKDYDTLFAAADSAAYVTKHSGKNGFTFYSDKSEKGKHAAAQK